MDGLSNPSFISNTHESLENGIENCETLSKDRETSRKERDNWSNDIEFLFSCISLSVGLGNIWRFPYVALGFWRRFSRKFILNITHFNLPANGGGAFIVILIESKIWAWWRQLHSFRFLTLSLCFWLANQSTISKWRWVNFHLATAWTSTIAYQS